MSNVTGIDHGFESARAAGYRAAGALTERMMRRANGEVVESPSKVAAVREPVPVIEVRRQPIVREVVRDTSNTVTIENNNIPFEIAYPHDTKLMSIGLTAMSVDISEDSVSILMQDTVQIKLPKLVPLHLKVEGKPYSVCWAGGSHKFGKFKHISFVIVE